MAIQSINNSYSILNHSLPTPHGRPWFLLTPYVKNLEDATIDDFFHQLKDAAELIQQLTTPIIKDSAIKPLGEIIFSLVLCHMRLSEQHISGDPIIDTLGSPTDSLRAIYEYRGFDSNLFQGNPSEHIEQQLGVLQEVRFKLFDLTLSEIEKITKEPLALPDRKIPYSLEKEDLLPLLKRLFIHKFPLRVLYRETNHPFSPLVLSPFEHLFKLLEGLEAKSLSIHRRIRSKSEQGLPSSYSRSEIKILTQSIGDVKLTRLSQLLNIVRP